MPLVHTLQKFGFFDINFFSNFVINSENSNAAVSSRILTPTISKVYNNIRNLCIIIMMLVLMYIGIKILISSIAEQQAKYKQLLIDWFVAFSLLFIMHYIMSFIVNINSVIIEMLRNDEGDSYYILADTEPINAESHYEISELVCFRQRGTGFEAEDSLDLVINLNNVDNVVNLRGEEINTEEWGDNGKVYINAVIPSASAGFYNTALTESITGSHIYKLNTMSYVRTIAYHALRDKKAYLIGSGVSREVSKTEEMGYTVLYVVLVIETIMFAVIYTKRVIQLAFLTMIAPLVALMYPIDKIGDGKAQAFNSWFKDYLFGVLIQPMHLLLYTVFIRAAGSLLQRNIIYALAIYAYMIPAEKYFKKLLGFEKSSGVGSGGPIAGALGAGLAMGGLNRLAGIGPGPKGGGGKGKTDPRKHKIPKRKFDVSSSGTPGSAGLGGATPSSSGRSRGRFGSRTSGVPGAGGGAGGKKKRQVPRILTTVPRSIGRTISRAATGGRYESLLGTPGAARAAFTNLTGKGFRGAARVIGAASGGAAGLILGTASAIVNGNEGDIFKGALIGVTAGNKQFGNAAGWITGGAGSFADTVSHDLASGSGRYADRLRTQEAFEQFSPDLADLSSSDRAKYSKVIEKMSPYVDFGSFDEVKSMAKAMEMAAPGTDIKDFDVAQHGAAADAIFKAAKNWGDLKNQDAQNSYLKFIDADVRAGVQNGSINVPVTPEIQAALNKAKTDRDEALQKQEEELQAEYDKKLRNARDRNRQAAIHREYNRKLSNIHGATDAELLENIKVEYAKQQKLKEVLASQEDIKK